MSIILTRRSVRVFKDDAVDPAHIEFMVRAGMQAPSAKNQQPWRFLVIKNKALLEQLSTVSQGARHLANAPLGLVVTMLEEDMPMPHMRPLDCAAATQNILLAAHEQDLGAVWIGVFPLANRIEKVRSILNIASTQTPFALIAIGHPKHAVDAKPRDTKDRVEVYE